MLHGGDGGDDGHDDADDVEGDVGEGDLNTGESEQQHVEPTGETDSYGTESCPQYDSGRDDDDLQCENHDLCSWWIVADRPAGRLKTPLNIPLGPSMNGTPRTFTGTSESPRRNGGGGCPIPWRGS